MGFETELEGCPVDATGQQDVSVDDYNDRWQINIESAAGTGTMDLHYLPPGGTLWVPTGAPPIDLDDASDSRGWKIDWVVDGFRFVPSNPAAVYTVLAGYSTVG